MLVENRSFHPVLYFRKQPKRGVPKNSVFGLFPRSVKTKKSI